jgi:hypothetical protein
LLVFGRTPEQLYVKIPPVCDAMILERFGKECGYHWAEDDDDSDVVAPGFVQPDKLGTLVPEEACA